jgi:Family of unknown function (DUF6052)
MNGHEDLPAAQEQLLRECYRALHELAASCAVPAVRAAARTALADLYPAIEGQALDCEMYSHRWEEAAAPEPPGRGDLQVAGAAGAG